MVTEDDDTTPGLPSGLVTFVFTDIEGSTRLYKALGESVAGDVFDLHNELLRAAWTSHRGHEVHTEGDSFFVVFEEPDDAVAACIAAQKSLATATWPEGGDVKIRVGIHCGLAAPRNDDYMALSVHQAARVMSAANGDQIMITDAIAQRLETDSATTLTRLGTFRLRDFDELPVLYRVDHQDLSINDTPARATPANHHNLVPRLTSFVGRDADLVTVNGLLEAGKAVTLVGPGGMGKTRLAIEVGLEVASAWAGGVWMVELAEVVDPDQIVEEIALSVGLGPVSSSERRQELVDFISDQTMLILLDNVEHLIEDCARLVPDLLRSCPNLTLLSTSREPLNCQGEIVYRVQPLELSFEADDPTKLPSVELFIDRARAVSVNFAWTDDAVAEVLEICRHLDGLPLAIEIAAAQVSVLQLPEIRDGLNNRFRLLRSRDRALPARQRTMEGLLGWSYQLLEDIEQRAFRRLAVFAGSFSIDAAEAALAGEDLAADDVPELIWTLVDKSLIAADLSDSATRYRLLESVQHYAMRLLIDNDDPVRSSVALGIWLLDQIAPWQVNDRRWLGEVAIELANIRNVVALIAEIEPEMAQQLMCSVGRYHDAMQAFDVGVDELTRASRDLAHESPSRIALLGTLADLHLRLGDTDSATAVLETAHELQQRTGSVGWNDVAVERPQGEVLSRSGDFDGAIQLAEDALRQGLSSLGAARMWNLMGIALFATGEPAAGLEAFRSELASYVAANHAPHIGSAHGNIAEAAWRLGDIPSAAHHQDACLDEALALGQRVLIAYSLLMAAQIAGPNGSWTEAVQLQACAGQILEDAGHSLYDDDQQAHRDLAEQATETLGQEPVKIAASAGRALTIVDAAAMAKAVFVDATTEAHAE